MNEEFILKHILPYLNEFDEITYEDFEKLFALLNQQEKYSVVNLLIRNNIELVEEKRSITPKKRGYENQYVPLPDTKAINISNEQLCTMYQQGNKLAGEMLMAKNERLVMKQALRYANTYRHKLDVDDLKQAGFIGMLRAATGFDIKQDTKFSTYAMWWINQSIMRLIADEGFTIRVPVHVFETVNKINRLEKKYLCQSIKELVDVALRETEYSAEKVKEILRIREHILSPASLNKVVGEDEDSELIHFVPEQTEPLEDIVIRKVLTEKILDITPRLLKEREREVLEYRFGLIDNKKRTLEEVGEIFHLTRERIRQIEVKAISKLRRNKDIKKLMEWGAI